MDDASTKARSSTPRQPDLTTQGEYSVLSEDALWDAYGDQQTLAWQWMRDCIETLDRDRNHSNQSD